MKRLILLSSCSHDHPHEHPLADHGHEHTHDHSHDLEHEHYSAFNLGCRTPTSFASTRRRPALPWLDTTPIGTKGLSSGTIHKAIITTRCHDPEHTGYIAFRATWDTGAEVDFVYKCPEED